jgi:glutaredoxin
MIIPVVIVLCLLSVLYLLTRPKKYTTEGLVVYGSKHCGWCKKQRDALDGHIEYTYVECSDPANKERCSSFKGFPTIVNGDQVIVGFRPLDKLMSELSKNETVWR